MKYNIDVSLFERLIKNKFPNVRLNIQVNIREILYLIRIFFFQHRMRPEIARLMKHFYDDLEDHASVNDNTKRAPVRGIESTIFFIDHNHEEANVDDGNSRRNEFEADYVVELAQYLIKQDYKPQQITLLVMYLGQKQLIAKRLKQKSSLSGIRIMVHCLLR